jgi:hypothetical protein
MRGKMALMGTSTASITVLVAREALAVVGVPAAAAVRAATVVLRAVVAPWAAAAPVVVAV